MKQSFWTVQKKSLIEQIKNTGIYQPNFSKSPYLDAQAEFIKGLMNGYNSLEYNLNILYGFILDSFNHCNNSDYKGLVFTFQFYDKEGRIYQANTFEKFKEEIVSKRDAIRSLWSKYFNKDEYSVVHVVKEMDFNPICIDMNNFQALMPPISLGAPFSKEYYNNLCELLSEGEFCVSLIPSYIVQAHIPNIMQGDIEGIYPLFELE